MQPGREEMLDVLAAGRVGDAAPHLAVFDDDERRQGLDAEALVQSGLLLDLDLHELERRVVRPPLEHLGQKAVHPSAATRHTRGEEQQVGLAVDCCLGHETTASGGGQSPSLDTSPSSSTMASSSDSNHSSPGSEPSPANGLTVGLSPLTTTSLPPSSPRRFASSARRGKGHASWRTASVMSTTTFWEETPSPSSCLRSSSCAPSATAPETVSTVTKGPAAALSILYDFKTDPPVARVRPPRGGFNRDSASVVCGNAHNRGERVAHPAHRHQALRIPPIPPHLAPALPNSHAP